ncbi:hypothetical protein [Streptomyces sp. NPDC057509]|uniref:hypothetical protein n=1 Tax=Streptomyces sp. NPDC057509 TaxID=3346152 RepID=UPI0036997714
MAGESPDRSKQQKSSGTTRTERDPRLDIFREPAARPTEDAETAPDAPDTLPDAPDTLPDASAALPDAPDAPDTPEAAETAGEPGKPENGAAEPAEGDARLRAAVAAWVSTPDDDEASGAVGASGGGGVSGDAGVSGGGGVSGGAAVEEPVARVPRSRGEAAEPEAAASSDEAGSDAGAGAGADEAAEAAEPKPDAVAAEPETDEAEGADEPEAASGKPETAAPGKAEGEPAADEKASASTVGAEEEASASTAGADEEASAAAEAKTGEPAPGDEPERPAAKAPAAEPEAEKAEGEPEADEPAPAAPAETDAPERPAAQAPADEPVTDTDKPAPAAQAEAERDADGSEGSADEPAPDADEPERPAAKAPADEPAPDAGKAPNAPAPDAGKAPNAPAPDAGKAPNAPAPDAGKAPSAPAAEADAGKAPVVDQPTAVFKAPRLPRVDQPTTALKITRSSSGKPESVSAPESLTERTSTFVPLRSDDVRPAPVPRRPGAPGDGADAGLSAASLGEAERTRQQPMPPRPPLDLLAELTNTPPPPETPVRTAVRRVKIWTPLVLLLLIVFAIVQMVRPLPDPSLTMTAKSTYSFDGDAPKLPWPDQGQGYMAATGLGKVDSFGEQKPVPIASVAKAMTAYLVLKSHPLKRGEDGPGIKIDAKAEADGTLNTEGESTLDTVHEGDTLTERDALAALMIPSANNIARLLARWEAGSEKAFVAKMNATADELGMKNTTYTDPSGLTASTVSTAEDLVKLGEKLVEFPALMDITKLPEWEDPSGKKWRNYNTLVPFDGALGIKTGSTTKAGGNLLFAAHKMIDGTDQLIVGAVLGQYDDMSIIDEVNAVSKKVMLATLDLLEGSTIVKKGDVVGEVDDGLGHTTPVVATKDVKAVGWSGLTVKLELTDDGKTIPHEAAAGTHVGTLTVGEGASQVKVAVALSSDLEKPSAGSKLTRLG